MNNREVNGRKVLLKIRTGSHLYGTTTEKSDEDFIGVFMPNPEDLLGINRAEDFDLSTKKSNNTRRNNKDDVDTTYYSIQKYIRLLLQNNPNILETLFVSEENIIFMDASIQELFLNYDKFVSQRVFKSFGGYAYSQKAKMVTKKERYQSLCIAIDWLEKEFVPHMEKYVGSFCINQSEADDLNKRIKYYKGEKENCESFHKGMDLKLIYEKLVAERNRYGWRVKTNSFVKVGYDVKFGYHLFRLLMEGCELLNTGMIKFPLHDSILNFIHCIRNCEISYEELLHTYNIHNEDMELIFKRTQLPKNPDQKWANQWLIDLQLQHIYHNVSEIRNITKYYQEKEERITCRNL